MQKRPAILAAASHNPHASKAIHLCGQEGVWLLPFTFEEQGKAARSIPTEVKGRPHPDSLPKEESCDTFSRGSALAVTKCSGWFNLANIDRESVCGCH